jgi:opacity protein-like surface antigen
MCVKTAKLRANVVKQLCLFLATFIVCSVSFEAFAYPVDSSDADTSHFTKDSPRTSPKYPQKAQSETSTTPFAPGTQNLSLGIGQVFLLGNLGNNFDNAIGPEIHYDYGVSDLFAFESNFGYAGHSRGSAELNVWNISAGLRTNLAYFDQLVPYINADLGFYHPSFTYDNGGSASTTLFGMQVGAGIDLLISHNVFFGTALTYNNMFDATKTDSNGVSRSMGGAYVSFMVHAGYSW